MLIRGNYLQKTLKNKTLTPPYVDEDDSIDEVQSLQHVCQRWDLDLEGGKQFYFKGSSVDIIKTNLTQHKKINLKHLKITNMSDKYIELSLINLLIND